MDKFDRKTMGSDREKNDRISKPTERYSQRIGQHQSHVEDKASRNAAGKLSNQDLAEGSHVIKGLLVLATACSVMMLLYIFFG